MKRAKRAPKLKGSVISAGYSTGRGGVVTGFEAKSGLRDESVEDVCAILQALEAVAHEDGQPVEGSGAEIGQAAFNPGPESLARVEVGGVAGQQVYPQPWALRDQVAHRGGDVGVQPVPDQDDRSA